MKDTLKTDLELILACRQGETRAWEQLLDKYERLVFSIPLNYGLAVEDAADVVQTTFTILTQSLDKMSEDTRLAAWLSTVARRHTWRWLHYRRRENISADQDLAEKELLGNGTDHSVERWEHIQWLIDGLNALSDRCRKLILALYFDPDSPSYTEIAERFRMPVGSIGPTRARCLEQLKQLLLAPVSE